MRLHSRIAPHTALQLSDPFEVIVLLWCITAFLTQAMETSLLHTVLTALSVCFVCSTPHCRSAMPWVCWQQS